jgi:hypothetical protein
LAKFEKKCVIPLNLIRFSHDCATTSERWNHVLTPGYTAVIVGTKSDLAEESKVSVEEVTEFCNKKNLPFVFVSSKLGRNTDQAVKLLLHLSIRRSAEPPIKNDEK